MQTLLVVGGVDLTAYLAHKGYKADLEDLDASAERSLSGTLTRERVARIPTIEASFIAGLGQSAVSTILKACAGEKLRVRYFDTETGGLRYGDFYAKIKAPGMLSTAGDRIVYDGFQISFKGYRNREGDA